MEAIFPEITMNGRIAAVNSIGDKAFSSYVFLVLDNRCPFYKPDGAGYRSCLWDVVKQKEAAYAKVSPTPAQIDQQCESIADKLDGLVAGEIVLSCEAYKLSQ